MLEPVPIASLNQYAFCPYRAWLMFVENEFADNVHTAAGSLEHLIAHTTGHLTREDVTVIRAVRLSSEQYGLNGVSDIIEETSDGYRPVEYKHGTHGKWENDALQVCAQAMCLEEALANRGEPTRITTALLWYYGSRRRVEVECDDERRKRVIHVAEMVREMMTEHRRPERQSNPKKCRGCSLRDICLPDEVSALREDGGNG